MKKNSITNKISPCCSLSFQTFYFWIKSLTLNSEANREFILSKLNQNGKLSLDGWKVLINSGTLETDSSLTKSEFLEWFDCGNSPNCEQLKIIIESYQLGVLLPSEIPDNIATIDGFFAGAQKVGNTYTKEQVNQKIQQLANSNFLGKLKTTDTPPTIGKYKGDVVTVGTYTNFKDSGGNSLVFTEEELTENFAFIYVEDNVSEKVLIKKTAFVLSQNLNPFESDNAPSESAVGKFVKNESKIERIDLTNVVENSYIKQITGAVNTGTSDFKATDFIMFPQNAEYFETSATYQQFAIYDANKTFIPYQDSTDESGKLYKIPTNAVYFRATLKNGENWFFRFYKETDYLLMEKEPKKIFRTPLNGWNAVQQALDIVTDATKFNRYQLNISGTFRIENSNGYNNGSYPAFVVPKDHVDIIGDSKENTIVWAELPYNDGDINTGIDRNLHQTLFNWADDCLIKNITWVAKNTRYVLHQDSALESNKTRRYEDCDFIFIGNKGSLRAFGIGTWSGSQTYVKGGKSVSHSAFPMAFHNAPNQEKESVFSFESHQMINFSGFVFAELQNSGSIVGDKFYLKDCSFGGGYQLNYNDWWIYTPNVNDHFNHAEWRILGSGNKPFLFENTVNGKALKITAEGIQKPIRFDESSSVYDLLIKNNKKSFGILSHPERRVLSGYIVHDFVEGLKSYAIGGISIREDNYIFGTTVSQDSIGKRLGNCTMINKNLRIYVGNIEVNLIFNKNYTAMTNSAIIAEMNTALTGVAIVSEYNIGKDYFPELTDVNFICANYTNEVILKGTALRMWNGFVGKALDGDEVFGIALDDFQPRNTYQGEVYGFGRVAKNCLMKAENLRLSSGLTIQKNKRYSAINGEIVENLNGELISIDNNILKIN